MKIFLLLFVKIIARLVYNFKYSVSNEFLDDKSGRIIAANHQSSIDALFLWAMTDGKATIVASKEAMSRRGKIIRWLSRYFDIVYVSETSSSSATRTIISQLKNYKTIIIFPEGKITIDGYLSKLQQGTAYIALKSHANIYPVTIDGLLGSRYSKVNMCMTGYVSAIMGSRIIPPTSRQDIESTTHILSDRITPQRG